MKKRFLSVLLTIAMIASVMVTGTVAASADEATTVTPLIWEGATQYCSVTNEVYHGDTGYSLKFPANVSTNHSIVNRSVLGKAADTYTLTFYSYPVGNRYVNLKLENTSGDANYDWNWMAGATVEEQADGWYKHTYVYKAVPEGATLNKFYFEVKNDGHNIEKDVYIDDITLTNSAGENILANGDFELYEKESTIPAYTLPSNWTPNKGGNATDDVLATLYSVTNSIAADGNNSLKISAIGQPSNCQYYLRPIVAAGTDVNTYELSVRVNKPTSGKLDTHMKVFDTNNKELANINLKWKTTPPMDADGWYTYKTDAFTSTAAIKTIDFAVNESTEEFHIDDMKLIKVGGDGTNYIVNGSFELIPKANTIAEYTLPKGYVPAITGNATQDVMDTLYTVVNNEAAAGENSLKINAIGQPSNAHYYLRPSVISGMGAGTYVLGIKVKGNPSMALDTHLQAFSYNNESSVNVNLKWRTAPTPDIDGWYAYTSDEFTITADVKTIDFCINESTKIFYVDDLTLTKVGGDGTNYIYNGSFEEIMTENTLPAGQLPASYTLAAHGKGTYDRALLAYQLVDNEAYTGKNSVKANALGILSGEQYRLTASVEPNLQPGNYTLSIMVKGSVPTKFGATVALIDTQKGELVKNDLKWLYSSADNYTITAMGLGWTKYEWKVAAANAPRSAYFEVYEIPSEYYIDDFTLTLDGGDGTNLIANGGFEKVPMAANTLPDGYTISGQGVADYAIGNYITVTDDDGCDGDHSLQITNSDGTWNNQWVILNHTLAQPAPAGGTYTLSLDAKDFYNGSRVTIYAMNGVGEIKFQYPESLPQGEMLEDGWTRYSIEMTTEANKDITALYIKLYEPANMLIDCLSLTDASGKEYVTNGSFENYTIKDYTISAIKDDNMLGYSVEVQNINAADGVPVTMIAKLTDLLDPTVCYLTKLSSVNVAKGKTETVKVKFDLDELPDAEFEIYVYVWNGKNLKPYFGVTQVY